LRAVKNNPSSPIDPATLQAYRETAYRVLAPPPFALRIGQPSAELLARHRRRGVACSAFITACNPHSWPVSEEANAQRQAELAQELTRRGLAFEPGIGQHPSNDWPGEPSWLVHGLALEAARRLGGRWEQNAVVWSGADGMPQLILLR